MKIRYRSLLWLIPVVLVVFLTWYAWPRLPIITAFAAKGMCSSVFLAEKDPGRVYAEDLSFFPISLAKCKIDYNQRIVTAQVLGLAKREAVYREGLGAVLVLENPVEELKSRSFLIPDPGYHQDTVPWPKGDLLPEGRPGGVDYQRLDSVVTGAFDRPGDEPMIKTLAVAVVYDGQLVAEKYLEGYDLHTMFHGWSMTKSITGALIGTLVDDGIFDVTDPAGFEEWYGTDHSSITVENLLHMTSGLEWLENYFTISEATLMLMQSPDMMSYIIEQDLAHEPGTYWSYSSGDANLLSGVIRRKLESDQTYHSYPYTRLLHRIGMHHTTIETDAAGLFVASSYSYGSTRDWARLGLLFLNDGIFAGDTVLSREWVEYMRSEVPESGGTYGATFWLQEPDPEKKLTDIPDDIFFADGFLGQRIYIIPSEKLVVVRMGYSLSNFNPNDFLSDIIATLPRRF